MKLSKEKDASGYQYIIDMIDLFPIKISNCINTPEAKDRFLKCMSELFDECERDYNQRNIEIDGITYPLDYIKVLLRKYESTK